MTRTLIRHLTAPFNREARMTSVEWTHEISIDDGFVAEFEVLLELEPEPDWREDWYINHVCVLTTKTWEDDQYGLRQHRYHTIKRDDDDWRGWLARELYAQANDSRTDLNKTLEAAWAKYLQEDCMIEGGA